MDDDDDPEALILELMEFLRNVLLLLFGKGILDEGDEEEVDEEDWVVFRLEPVFFGAADDWERAIEELDESWKNNRKLILPANIKRIN